MNKTDEFLRSQKILRLATVGKNHMPHIAPVWYMYSGKKIYIGTNTKTQKIKNLKKNKHVSFCVDVGVHEPNIYGVMGQGDAVLILDKTKIQNIAKKILLRYFDSMEEKSAKQLLDITDCIISIMPKKLTVWSY